MAVLLHHTEIWVHGVLLVLHIVAGIIIGRVPLTILCIIAYIAATLTQRMAFKDEAKHEQSELPFENAGIDKRKLQ